MKVLFVCLGNICRSPLAEVQFQELLHREGLADHVIVDSAGTSGWHQGEAADSRARETARQHGTTITHRSRPLVSTDYSDFDYLIAMDRSVFVEMQRRSPESGLGKIFLYRHWDRQNPEADIPDPYYGEQNDFEDVWQLCEKSSTGFLAEIKNQLSLRANLT